MTATQLAEEVEVTVRTIYRDVEALQAAGVPIYGEPGHGGGYRIIDGFRTRLNGVTLEEAKAMFLTGVPSAAVELGLSEQVHSVALKLKSALPPAVQELAESFDQRFLFDPSGWDHDGDSSAFLKRSAIAVREQRPIEIAYESWTHSSTRRLLPHGLVLKGGRWYLVACRNSSARQPQFRTYRVSQITELAIGDGRFDWTPGFDLSDYWVGQIVRFRQELTKGEATIRISPKGRMRMREVGNVSMLAAIEGGPQRSDDDGWITAKIPIESDTHAIGELLRLGAEVEVVAPARLRKALGIIVSDLSELYRPNRG